MSQLENMKCWEIMQCSDSELCPARQNPDNPCWEIAAKLKSPQSVMNICDDCIVYLVKTNDPKLSQTEQDDILQFRYNQNVEDCPLCATNGNMKNT